MKPILIHIIFNNFQKLDLYTNNERHTAKYLKNLIK